MLATAPRCSRICEETADALSKDDKTAKVSKIHHFAGRKNTTLRVARLVEEVPEFSELDLDPIIALPPGRGCLIVDARIGVEP